MEEDHTVCGGRKITEGWRWEEGKKKKLLSSVFLFFSAYYYCRLLFFFLLFSSLSTFIVFHDCTNHSYMSNGIPSSSSWAYSSCTEEGAVPKLTSHSKTRIRKRNKESREDEFSFMVRAIQHVHQTKRNSLMSFKKH